MPFESPRRKIAFLQVCVSNTASLAVTLHLLKIITRDMVSYDEVYKKLIEEVELETVTSYFAMEAIEEQRPIPM